MTVQDDVCLDLVHIGPELQYGNTLSPTVPGIWIPSSHLDERLMQGVCKGIPTLALSYLKLLLTASSKTSLWEAPATHSTNKTQSIKVFSIHFKHWHQHESHEKNNQNTPTHEQTCWSDEQMFLPLWLDVVICLGCYRCHCCSDCC